MALMSCNVILFIYLLFITPAWGASFLSAPHTESNGVFCKDCHLYPFTEWPDILPPVPTIDETVKNGVCLKCHGDTGSAPTKAMHSSLSMADMGHYPEWSTECVDCHDPHFQDQLSHAKTDSAALYLATGSINSVTAFGASSIIEYSALSAQPDWLDPATWSAKTGQGRGLIFVDNAVTPQETYEVIAADSTSITVSGTVQNSATGNTFGLIYGQFIRKMVRTPSGEREVSFYDPQGGYTDTSGSPSPTGVCQVCHSQTLYWTADGNNTAHNSNSKCTSCHDAAKGFTVTGHDHSLTVSNSLQCASCHTTPDIIGVTHLGSCITCHGSIRPEVQTAIASGTAECISCHGSNFSSIHPPTVVDHSLAVQLSAGCNSCHTATLVDANDPKVHNSCASCHDSSGNLMGSALGKTAPNECITCHTSGFFTIHPATTDHSNIVTVAGTTCAACHTSTLVDALDPMVHNSCGSCHDTNGVLISLATAATAPSSCIICHGITYFEQHLHDHSSTVTASLSCSGCHTAADIVTTTHKNNCATCHNSTQPEVVTAIAAGAAECISCHTEGGHTLREPYQACGSCHFGTHDEWAWPPAANGDKLHDKHVNSLQITDCAQCHGPTSPSCGGCHTHSSITQGPGGGLHNKHTSIVPACSTCHISGIP